MIYSIGPPNVFFQISTFVGMLQFAKFLQQNLRSILLHTALVILPDFAFNRCLTSSRKTFVPSFTIRTSSEAYTPNPCSVVTLINFACPLFSSLHYDTSRSQDRLTVPRFVNLCVNLFSSTMYYQASQIIILRTLVLILSYGITFPLKSKEGKNHVIGTHLLVISGIFL